MYSISSPILRCFDFDTFSSVRVFHMSPSPSPSPVPSLVVNLSRDGVGGDLNRVTVKTALDNWEARFESNPRGEEARGGGAWLR